MIDPLWFAATAAVLLVCGMTLAALSPSTVVGHPRLVLGVLGAVSLAAAGALLKPEHPWIRIEVDSSTGPMLPRDDPDRDVYANATAAFGTDDLYLIALPTEETFTRENLEMLRRISKRISRIEGVRSVESLIDVPHFGYDAENRWVEVRPFIQEIPEEPDELAALRERALADPIYTRTIVSPDGRTAAITLTFMPMSDGDFVRRDLDGRIRAIVAEEVPAGRTFHVTGRPHIRSEAHWMLVRDMLRLIPIAIGVATALLWLMTGSLRGTLVPLTSNLTATLWVFGAMAATGVNMNLITLVLGPMLICVGCVYGVHVLARYEAIAREEQDAGAAALVCLEYCRTPVLMAGATTVVGFAALLVSDIPATNELGLFAILGVASVTLLSLTGVPAALALLPLRDAEGRPRFGSRTRLGDTVRGLLERGLGALAGPVSGRPGTVLLGWTALAIGAAVAIPSTVTDTDFIRYFLESSRVRRDFDAVNELLTGAVPIYVTVSSGEGGAFRDPEALRGIETAQRRLEELPGVRAVLSPVDFVKRVQAALDENGGGPGRIPDSRAATAEAVFMIPKAKMRRFATSDHGAVNLVVRTGELGSASMRALERRIEGALEETGLRDRYETHVTGNTILLNHSADGIAANQSAQVGLATLAILLLASRTFRSLRLGMLAMVPNVVPVLLFFGALGAGAATLSIPTSLIGCIALGIAVDDTVHFLVAYRHARHWGESPEEAARNTIARVGQPIAMTSIMLVAGFLVITLSGFATLREFGYLTALTMAICLSTDLTLLPSLLVRARS